MADISKIKMPNNTSYDLKDAAARESIAALPVDVQINGTSILNNQIANIPLASTDTLGVVKANVNGLYGICIAQELVNNIPTPTGELGIAKAANSAIKSGTDNYRPIVPSVQHRSVFYGLAKAAEDTTQSTSSNAIGVYTDTAKQKIQNMLGITDLISTEESSTATVAHAVNSLFLMDGKLYKTTAAIAIGDAVTVGTNCEVVKVDEIFVKNTDIPIEYGTGIGSLQTKSFTYNKNIYSSTASGIGATAIGISTQASGTSSHSEGDHTIASGPASHAEGMSTTANKAAAHAEGATTTASGVYAHAEGSGTTASGLGSHSEGFETTASGVGSHAEGYSTVAASYGSHSEGFGSQALGKASHVEGLGTIASGQSTHVIGQYNVDLNTGTAADVKGTYVEMIGNGTADNARSNAYALDWNGNGHYNGYVYVGCNASSTSGTRLPHDIQVNGTSVVNNGTANIPTASTDTFGVVKIGNGLGINSSNGKLQVNSSSSGNVKIGTDGYAPIVPGHQHESVFYGLSKAAGVDLANENVTVGIYPFASREAICNMLGALGIHNVGDGFEIIEDIDTGEKIFQTSVQDIQVNGTSIINNGVANIPLASTSDLGLVKIPAGNDQGISIIVNGDSNGNTISTGELTLIMATNAELKVADSTCAYRPISAYKAYRAVFYGLAKAAHDTTQAESSNSIGTYTDAAKIAIQTMLGAQAAIEVIRL